jgi:hypothetical protein
MFRTVIGQSRLGFAISRLRSVTSTAAYRVATVLSADVVMWGRVPEQLKQSLEKDRAMLMLSPAFIEASDLATAKARDESAQEMAGLLHDTLKLAEQRAATLGGDRVTQERQHEEWQQSVQAEYGGWLEDQKKVVSAWVTDTEKNLKILSELYHKQMQTEAAATYWQDKATVHRIIGWVALGIFVVLVAIPFVAAWLNFGAIRTFLGELTAATADKFSLTPVVALSIPALGYGWLLRHVSRIFIQNLALADDASYRRVMSMTFLGLSKDPASGITAAERGIILNALFRPAPPHSGDEGPPSGLLDIIKSPKA